MNGRRTSGEENSPRDGLVGRRPAPRVSAWVLAAAVGAWAGMAPGRADALTTNERAAMVLNAGRIAYNEGNYPLALERFKTYLTEHAKRPDWLSARYGTALVLLEGPKKDYQAAAEALRPVVISAPPAERPYAQYFMGVAQRGLGSEAAADPAAADRHLARAAQSFTQAADGFAQLSAAPVGQAAALPQGQPREGELTTAQWGLRSRLDAADSLLRQGKHQEAATALEQLLQQSKEEPAVQQDQPINDEMVRMARYLQGVAAFGLNDYNAAGRVLSRLAPFDDSEMGLHAGYLLGRVHHVGQERAEAAACYQAVLNGYARHRASVEERLRKAQTEPLKAQLQAILDSPAPDHVNNARFFWGVLLAEQNKPADALARLEQFIATAPASSLVPEAHLRQGVVLIQLKQFPEAIERLKPLVQSPGIGEQAMLWLARAHATAPAPNHQVRAANQTAAMGLLEQAAEKARAAANDPAARQRLGDILMELAGVQQEAGKFTEASATYQRILQENNPDWNELALQRRVIALNQGGQYGDSDQAAAQFAQLYPKSSLLPEVLFRRAENAYLPAAAAQGTGPATNELKALYAQAIERYKVVIEQFPGHRLTAMSRLGVGMALYQQGQYPAAAKALKAIPETDRGGEVGLMQYLLADCLLRTLPEAADDALSTARMLQQLQEAANLLTAFTSVQETSPHLADGLIKLGYVQQRVAATVVAGDERGRALGQAKLAYQRVMQKFPGHPLYAVAVFEGGKNYSMLGNLRTAVRELSRFNTEPLKSTPMAPLALMHLADYTRLVGQPAEAVAQLEVLRKNHEDALLKDPERAEWVPTMQYTLALALKDARKHTEARELFDHIAKTFPSSPEAADSAWRAGQSRREEAVAQLAEVPLHLSAAGEDPEKLAAVQAMRAERIKAVEQIAAGFTEAAGKLSTPETAEQRQKLLYEAAWCYRAIADVQIDAIRYEMSAPTRKLAKRHRLQAKDIPWEKIEVQPGERRVRELYQQAIAAAPDTTAASDARFELAELLVERGEPDAAAPLLTEVLQRNPTPDLIEKARIRLGSCHMARKEFAAAIAQFEAVPPKRNGWLGPIARYGAGEAYLALKNYPKAIEIFLPFRDGDLRRFDKISVSGVILLGQAYAGAGDWAQSQKTFELFISRNPRVASVYEAYYGLGNALQNQRQYDAAVEAFTQVVNRSATETAARAQLQIGLCRLAQQRPADALTALMIVPVTYDYPEITAAALCEASAALVQLNRPAEARELLERVIRENPDGSWPELARTRLAQIK